VPVVPSRRKKPSPGLEAVTAPRSNAAGKDGTDAPPNPLSGCYGTVMLPDVMARGRGRGAGASDGDGEGLVRFVRLMLAHGRVVVMMRQGRQEATQCPLRTGSMVRGPG
jgi:hypothetical protein